MCCFSRPVESVSATKIFARLGAKGNQVLIYQMALNVSEEVAMILPIPVNRGSGEEAVQFFDFSKYQQVFADLSGGFSLDAASPFGPIPQSRSALKVVSVGSFDASFVPTLGDFGRLDRRFRIADEIWSKLPGYADYGFAVFKLKSGNAPRHPMAFAFPTSRPGHVFFPTLHIHDGEVHAKAEFDHVLYAQSSG